MTARATPAGRRPARLKLWRANHPYYGPDGNGHEDFASWVAFVDEWGEVDLDYNFLYRWDWHEGSQHDLAKGEARLYLCFVQQRKGQLYSVHVAITRDDEPAIRAWLQKAWKHVCAVWAPFGMTPGTAPGNG